MSRVSNFPVACSPSQPCPGPAVIALQQMTPPRGTLTPQEVDSRYCSPAGSLRHWCHHEAHDGVGGRVPYLVGWLLRSIAGGGLLERKFRLRCGCCFEKLIKVLYLIVRWLQITSKCYSSTGRPQPNWIFGILTSTMLFRNPYQNPIIDCMLEGHACTKWGRYAIKEHIISCNYNNNPTVNTTIHTPNY